MPKNKTNGAVTAPMTQGTQSAAIPVDLSAQMAELEALRAENAKLRRAATARVEQSMRIAVSAKGGVSVYGLGRWPVTLYREQWERLLGIAPAIADFLVANAASLKVKGGETDEAPPKGTVQ